MTKRNLYLGACLTLTLLFAAAVRALNVPIAAPEAPKPAPVQVFGAIGCNGKYVAWVVFSNGKVSVIDESSGMKLPQLAELLLGVPAQVRHFDSNCPIAT